MSPVRVYGDPDEEAASIARSRQSWDRVMAARAQVTAGEAMAVSTMAANYPHMSPGTVMPLARAGVAPDDPLAQKVALEEAKKNKKSRGFLGAIGDIVGGITHIPATGLDFAVSNVLNPLGGAALDVAKPVMRRTLAGAMFLPELGAAGIRTAADIGGNVLAGAASGAAVGAGVGAMGFNPLTVAGGAIGGAFVGAGAGALAEARGVNIESEGGFENPFSQTTVGQMAAGKSLGSGYMPGGEAAKAQAESARRSAAIGGHALTPGRFLASSVLEPGTGAYNLLSGAMDATVAWKLDPTAAALGKAGAARKSARMLSATEKEVQAALAAGKAERLEAGLVEGARKTVIGEKVNTFLGTRRGEKVLDWFAENDFETIRKGLGKDRVDVETVRDLARATTREEVDAILRPKLGIDRGLELKPQVGGLGMTVRQGLKRLPGGESRLWNDLPSGELDYSNPTDAVNQFNLLLNDANVLGDDAARFTEEFADLVIDGSYQSRRKADALVYRSLITGIGSKIDQSGSAVEFLAGVARRAADGDAKIMQSLINEDVTKTVVRAVSIDGQSHGLVDAGFLMSHADAGITVDRTVLRDIRSTTSKYSRLLNHPKVKLGESATQHFTDDIWKPMQLLRGAWTVRVVGEEQIRMAASGRMSLFNHPLAYLAWAMDDESRIAQILGKVNIKAGRGATTFEGERFAKEGTTIVSAADDIDAKLLDGADYYAAGLGVDIQAQGWARDGHTVSAKKETYVKGQTGHLEAVAENIDKAYSDPLVRRLAGAPLNDLAGYKLAPETLSGIEETARAAAEEAAEAAVRRALKRTVKEGEEVAEGAVKTAETAAQKAARRAAKAAAEEEIPPGVRKAKPKTAKEPAELPELTEEQLEIVERAREAAYRAAHEVGVADARKALAAEDVSPTGEEVWDWFVNGDGNKYRQALVDKHAARLNSNADVTRHMEDATKALDKMLGADTGAGKVGSAELREAIITGELNGVPIRNAKGQINKEFINELGKLDGLPDQIVGSRQVADAGYQARRDAAVQRWFTRLMSKPSARLSRSPMFRQSYWGEAENLITELEPAAQARMIASAEKAKLDKATVQRLKDRAKLSSGDLKLHEADLVAKGRALDQTRDLLYDASKRGQMSDALRIIMPFAEAQKEVMKTWATIGTKTNPAALRRAQQVLQGARGSGVFYKDPTTGEEMFTFPGSQFLTEKTLGMPIPLTGRVAGLNTFGSGIVPGMGPAVQLPTRWLLPDKPRYDDLRKFLDPFGASSEESEGILEGHFPSWVKSIKRSLAADDSDRAFANAVKDVWAMGVSSGRYRTDTPEDIKEGLDNAKSNAKWLYFIKGASTVLGAPTPPSPEFMAMDKDGKWQVAKQLSEDYRKMADDPEIGIEGASAAFLEKYGNNAFAFMQAKSYATVPSAPSSADFGDWSRTGEAQALQKKYGDVAALFGPQGEGFDYATYLRNIRSGDTQSLTPQQFAEQANDRIAKMIFYNQKDRFGPTPSKEQRAWLSELRQTLRDKYPGFDIPLPGKPDQKTVKDQYIPAIEKAVKDDALEDSDVANAARAYLQARQMAQQSAEGAGYTNFTQAKAAAPLRDWLRQILDALVQKVPDFAPMAERVFDREMDSDDLAEAGVTAA